MRSQRVPVSTLHSAARILFAILIMGGATAAQEVAIRVPHWWTVATSEVSAERGRFSELAKLRRVYVETTFTDARTISSPSPTSQGDIHRAIMQAVASTKGLQIVADPSTAEFAIVTRASAATDNGEREPGNFSLVLDPTTEISIDMMVVIPGGPLGNGTRRPRIVWDSFSPNAKVEADSAARFMVSGFLSEFQKLRSQSK